MSSLALTLLDHESKRYEREFVFTLADFNYIRELVKQRTGINLSEAKRDLVYSRLAKRLRATKLTSFKAYCALAEQRPDELVNLINAITTNLTAFFREQHHFEYLRGSILPALMADKGVDRTLRIWSAGCSSGEEPYSIAMTVLDALGSEAGRWDIGILASDLDSNMVATAERGIYTEERVAGISPAYAERWLRRGVGENAGKVRVCSEVRDLITFKQLNLMDSWPMKSSFDLIFCRNVVIYFDKPTQRVLFDRYAKQLQPHGWLFIGHSESLFGVSERYKLEGKTIYRKVN